MEFSLNAKICIYILTVFYLFINGLIEKKDAESEEELGQQESKKEIFSLYYINTDKVYEIAMLLNNRIITGGTSENESESRTERQTNLGISTNLNYLESVKGDLSISQNTQTANGIKNKVLENFDVKTTKSNMLSEIIARAKVFTKEQDLDLGDLVLLKNASLTLLNEEDSFAVTKMILNGAFKDTKISSNTDDMKMELDLSAMINSLLKDCAYELGCNAENVKFLLNIPMTFESDFENSYNIYDLQVGTVTVVGIYRGKRQYKKRLSLQDLFSDNEKRKVNTTYENTAYQLQSSRLHSQSENKSDINQKTQGEVYQDVIDVIAVIQEINAKEV